METKRSRTYNVKAKLIAAMCLLLVATTLAVSASYAWFVLSTAPEVKGIDTSVGANGALEIWLNTADETDPNATHKNIVDLTNGNYGFDQIVLQPAKLNVNGGYINEHFVYVPKYSGEGIPDEVLNGELTYAGSLGNSNLFYPSLTGGDTGFRAVGAASGMTDRQRAFYNAKSSASSNAKSASTVASTTLNTNGATLGNIVIKKATVDGATYTLVEKQALGTILTDLETAINYIETAYEDLIVAYAASGSVNNDNAYATVRGWFADDTLTLAQIAGDGGITVESTVISLSSTEIYGGISALQNTVAKVQAARDAYDALADVEEYTWDDIDDIVSNLVNVTYVTLNGNDVNNMDMADLANSVMNEGVNLELNEGSGVFYDIAQHCGNYSATVEMTNVQAGSFTLAKLTANMKTKCNSIVIYLPLAINYLNTSVTPPSGDAVNELPMTQFYGYIIDLGFKTNAANSELLLQTDPVDRVYEGNTENDVTWGYGSYMTFKATDGSLLTNDQVKFLMSCIRIVLFDTETREIFAYAKLDVDNATASADGITAKIYLHSENGALITDLDDAVIKSLGQNTEEFVSAFVYLDGETIENEAVAAEQMASMTGSMNLQFSSSADLKPMEYGDLITE